MKQIPTKTLRTYYQIVQDLKAWETSRLKLRKKILKLLRSGAKQGDRSPYQALLIWRQFYSVNWERLWLKLARDKFGKKKAGQLRWRYLNSHKKIVPQLNVTKKPNRSKIR